MEWSERLQECRKKRGLSQEQAAQMLGVSRSTVSAYEKNMVLPSVDVLRRMAEVYEVTADYLLGLDHREAIAVDVQLTDRQKLLVRDVVRIMTNSLSK